MKSSAVQVEPQSEYRAILSGDYARRDGQERYPLGEDLRGAAKSYRDAWNNSTDPLVRVFSDVGGAVSGVADKAFSGFRRPGQQDSTDNGDAR